MFSKITNAHTTESSVKFNAMLNKHRKTHSIVKI